MKPFLLGLLTDQGCGELESILVLADTEAAARKLASVSVTYFNKKASADFLDKNKSDCTDLSKISHLYKDSRDGHLLREFYNPS